MELQILSTCPVCGSSDYREYSRGENWEYTTCQSCGLLYLRQRLPKDKLYSSYSGGWFKDLRRKLTYPFRKSSTFKNLEPSLSRCETIIDEIESYRYPAGRLLDVGCNKGYLIATAICRGWDAYGIELIPELPLVIKREFGIEDKVFIGDIDRNESYFDDNYFDCISLIDMIEHFDNPVSDLRKLNRILKTGGILFMQTPDFANILSRIHKQAWGGLNPREHLCIYNQRSLTCLLEKTGFRIIRQKSGIDKYCGNMVAIAEKIK